MFFFHTVYRVVCEKKLGFLIVVITECDIRYKSLMYLFLLAYLINYNNDINNNSAPSIFPLCRLD